MSDYPTERDLTRIKEWDLMKNDVSLLLDFVEVLWTYKDRFVRTNRTLYLSTGGWSGNEDIVEALRHNFLFWSMFWFKTQRGGHYWFDRRLVSKDIKGFITVGSKK